MTLQYLSKAFLRQNAFCDHSANPHVTDDTLTFTGDPMDVDSFVLSVRWKRVETGFQFQICEATNCTVFGPTGALKIGDIINWAPNDFDGDKIRFTIKLA